MKRMLVFLLSVLIVISSLSAFSQEVPYRIRLYEGTPVYGGPGEDFGYAREPLEDGIYTIVETAVRFDWDLWGRLESDIGWVNLSDVPSLIYQDVNYTVSLPAWVSIFEGPGYDYVYKALVGEDGVYTIVEEAYDEDYRVWGKLKSGAGWVDLDLLSESAFVPVIVSFADESLLESGEYIYCGADVSEYSVKIAVRANKPMQYMELRAMEWEEDKYVSDRILYSASPVSIDKPLVIEVTFWGDSTSFMLNTIDETGVERFFLIGISGRNGALTVDEGIVK